MSSQMSTDTPCFSVPDLPVSTTSFRDREGRRLCVATLGSGPRQDERAALERMYERYDTADRAQGLPPVESEALTNWLDHVLDGASVLAWDDNRVVGHAALYPVTPDRHELVIFVDSEYQGAGVGSKVLATLLEAHRERGGGTIQLSVEPTNEAAINLYRKYDFEVTSEAGLAIQMCRDI